MDLELIQMGHDEPSGMDIIIIHLTGPHSCRLQKRSEPQIQTGRLSASQKLQMVLYLKFQTGISLTSSDLLSSQTQTNTLITPQLQTKGSFEPQIQAKLSLNPYTKIKGTSNPRTQTKNHFIVLQI